MGIILSILTSLFSTAQNTAVKKAAVKTDTLLISWSIGAFSLFIIFPIFIIIIFLQGMPDFTGKFWMSLLYKTPLMIVAYIFYIKAHKYGELSLISPLLALTPVIILIIAPFLIGQKANIGGTLGVGLIVIGAYVLNFGSSKEGFWVPFTKIFNDKGAKFMMLAASIWAMTSVIDAMGVSGVKGNNLQAGSSWALFTNVALVAVLTPFVAGRIKKITEKSERKKFFLSGAFMGAAEICQMVAMTMLLAVYVNAIKRLSIVLNVIAGAVIFKEKDVRYRLIGSVIMLIGVMFIALSVI